MRSLQGDFSDDGSMPAHLLTACAGQLRLILHILLVCTSLSSTRNKSVYASVQQKTRFYVSCFSEYKLENGILHDLRASLGATKLEGLDGLEFPSYSNLNKNRILIPSIIFSFVALN